MSDKTFTLQVSKKGYKPKEFIKMTSVDDIYQQACLLNEEDRNKMLSQFKESINLAVNMRKACELESKKDDIKLPFFSWANSK